mgnify:CR=1 FL=1
MTVGIRCIFFFCLPAGRPPVGGSKFLAPPAGPSAVGCVVRAALVRAGLRRPRGYAAHIFRHSLATRMIRQGASIPEISEILRHRCPTTTQIYAKVDFETLRGVARAWPGASAGGGR